jgi:hypothetical protein
MVAHEPDRDDEEVLMAICGQLGQHRAGLGTEPRLIRRTGALVGEAPLAKTRKLRRRRRARSQLVGVRVACGEDPLRKAMGGEDDLDLLRRAETPERCGHPVGHRVEKPGLVPPAPYQGNL